MGYGVDDVGGGSDLELAGRNDGDGRWRTVGSCGTCQSCHHHFLQHGIVLLQDEVALGRCTKVNGLYDGQVSHVGHLDGRLDGRQVFHLIVSLGIGDGALFQLREIDAGTHDGLPVNGIGDASVQHHLVRCRFCRCWYTYTYQHQQYHGYCLHVVFYLNTVLIRKILNAFIQIKTGGARGE